MHLKKYSDGLVCYSTDRTNSSDPGVEALSIGINEVTTSDFALLYDWTPAQKDALEAVSWAFEKDWIERIQEPEGIGKLVSENYRRKNRRRPIRRIRNTLDKNKYIDKIRSSLPNILAISRRARLSLWTSRG